VFFYFCVSHYDLGAVKVHRFSSTETSLSGK